MAPLTLNDLPNDLKDRIVDQILLPSDLVNVCLVSKVFYDIAVRMLYRSITLKVGSPDDWRLTSFCNIRNPGLQHIRKIRMVPTKWLRVTCCKHTITPQISLIIKMILEILPENLLEDFDFYLTGVERIPADILLLLYKKQQKLEWIMIGPPESATTISDMDSKSHEFNSLFSSCTRLFLHPESMRTLELCQYHLQRVPHVEHLVIRSKFHCPQGPVSQRDLNDGPTQPGLFSSTIFRHMLPFDQCSPLANLNALELDQVSLRYCADTYCRVIDFPVLTTLHIDHCSGADALLSNLCKGSSLPHKLKTLSVRHRDNKENDVLTALDALLRLLSGLEELTIDLENVKTLPAVEGITRHAKTLEILSVHCFTKSAMLSDNKAEIIWPLRALEKICKTCVDLEQLSCGFPDTSITRYASSEWRCFAQQVVDLPSLVTLHITTWPGAQSVGTSNRSYTPTRETLPRRTYTILLQAMAQKLFDSRVRPHDYFPADRRAPSPDLKNASLPSPKLRLIAFGCETSLFDSGKRDDDQVIYLRSTQLTAMNIVSIAAAPVPIRLRQYIEPRSEVLDVLPCRVASMPVDMTADPAPIMFMQDADLAAPHGDARSSASEEESDSDA